MKWLLLVVLAVLVLGVLTLAVNAIRSIVGRRRDPEPEMRLRAPRCLRCRGTGWLNRDPERTFTFTGEGFANEHTPATMCPDCGGTGVAPAR